MALSHLGQNPSALMIISMAEAARTSAKVFRTAVFFAFTRRRVTRDAPMRMPRATGAVISGLTSPLAKYIPALAAAVTPIMKLEDVVETFIGRFIGRSMDRTL